MKCRCEGRLRTVSPVQRNPQASVSFTLAVVHSFQENLDVFLRVGATPIVVKNTDFIL